MNRILIISGPTATGKTALAVSLAKKYNGELISADSRQIYRGMDIGTGKDHPRDTIIHLIDIIDPSQSFSVAQYRQLAVAKIQEIQTRGKLPIVVGGSGQYIDAITNPRPTFTVKPNIILRFFLNQAPLKCLKNIYSFLDKETYLSLNNSDQNNPHRLIRKIEIKLSFKKRSTLNKNSFNVLHISLTAPNSYLYSQIIKRVEKRLKSGLLGEIKYLLKSYRWSDPGLNTLAYKEFKTGFDQKNIDHWLFDEHGLARRQKTWFKKMVPVSFLDITDPNYLQKAIDLVQKWYNLI